MSGPRVLFLPAFSPDIGGGHAFRCFTLAQALTARGANCVVGLSDEAQTALAAFAPADVQIAPLLDRLETSQAQKADIVVIDDYACGLAEELPLTKAGFALAIIDDLADREHLGQLLVDPGFGRRAGDYDGLRPPGATILAGPDYALLRPEFALMRAAALARRKVEFGHRTLISLGLTDVGGHTARAARLLAGLAPLDVVLGGASPSLSVVRELPSTTVHVEAHNMGELIAQADVGVGGGGVSTWERACLGLPSICVILADNQAPTARALDQAGAAIALDVRDVNFESRLVSAVERLFSDGELRDRLSQRAAHLCDGLGAERVADALLAKLG